MYPPSRATARLLALTLVLGAAACENEQSGVTLDQASRPGTSAALREATGLSHMPVPADKGALDASLRRHYPREQLGRTHGASVVVDVDLDEHGLVRGVRALPPPVAAPGTTNQIVVLDKAPGSNTPVQRAVNLTYDGAFGPAAEAALREVRFRPALRDGTPVSYTLRMTVEFAPQS